MCFLLLFLWWNFLSKKHFCHTKLLNFRLINCRQINSIYIVIPYLVIVSHKVVNELQEDKAATSWKRETRFEEHWLW